VSAKHAALEAPMLTHFSATSVQLLWRAAFAPDAIRIPAVVVTESGNKFFVVFPGVFRKSQFYDVFVATGSWRYKKSQKCPGLQEPEGDAKLQWLVEAQTFFQRRSGFVRNGTTNCDLGQGKTKVGGRTS
jgi:hypothetical protein